MRHNKKNTPDKESKNAAPKAFKKGMGRPSDITPELIEEICKYLKAGNYIETACAMVDIAKPTLYEWLKKGNREEQGIYRDFLNAVKRAQATAEVRDVTIIAKASENQWQAAAWRLERKFPDRWGRSVKVEMNDIEVNANINVSPEEEARIKEEYDVLLGGKKSLSNRNILEEIN
jgi:hypothetical protein